METPVVQNEDLEEPEYDPEFVAMILQSMEDIKAGRVRKVDIENLWE